jgi:hypothetical protein
MGKAREQEVRLMGFAFVALALLAALALILGATKIGSEVHSRPVATPGAATSSVGVELLRAPKP